MLGLLDDNLGYRANLGFGIAHRRLSPFAYLGALEGRIALVEVPAGAGSSGLADGDSGYVLKRVVRDGERWLLASDNPEGPTIPASADTTAIAIVEQVVRVEDVAPAVAEPGVNGEP